MSRRLRASALFLSLLVAVAPAWTLDSQEEPADLVLRGGRVATVDDAFTIDEAIAVRGHEVVATGSNAEIEAWIGDSTEVIELDGRLAVPGFVSWLEGNKATATPGYCLSFLSQRQNGVCCHGCIGVVDQREVQTANRSRKLRRESQFCFFLKRAFRQ